MDPKKPPPANEDRKTVDPHPPGIDPERKERRPAKPDDGPESEPADEPTHVCGKCGKRFETPEALSRHIAAMHPYPYKCSVCGMGLPDLRTLADHGKRSHGP